MRNPDALSTLLDMGIIERVLRPLLSGKEADVFLVLAGGQQRVAKVYKEAHQRSFKQRAEYTEGRQTRNSRDARAVSKRTKYGRAQDEAAWRNTEVDMIYRLQAAGVRVPAPWNYMDGVLIMELVAGADGNPAPRMGEAGLTAEEAADAFERMMGEVVKMLCAGVVHGDLSEFNVLMGADGPVVIDFPQSVDASSNQNARGLLMRDVDNLQRFIMQFEPRRRLRPYGQELWELFKRNELTPDSKPGGRYVEAGPAANTADVLGLVREANRDERKRREALGIKLGKLADEPAPAPAPAPAAETPETPAPAPRREPPAPVNARPGPPRRDERPYAPPPRRDAPAAPQAPRRDAPPAPLPPRRDERPYTPPPRREAPAGPPPPRRDERPYTPPPRREPPAPVAPALPPSGEQPAPPSRGRHVVWTPPTPKPRPAPRPGTPWTPPRKDDDTAPSAAPAEGAPYSGGDSRRRRRRRR